ncbi:MAG: hypothetical protein FWF36_08505, partial [Propionibacteriaceae bacterium]|nr:hypothetical protein [Propionibacteriaceae bacterium]
MGAASINISELETLLDNIDTVDATLSQAETDIKNARDNTKSYSYQVPQMVPCTVGPHGRPSYQLCHRVEWYHPPHPHLTSFDLTAWNNWRDTWSPFYHRALGYGID